MNPETVQRIRDCEPGGVVHLTGDELKEYLIAMTNPRDPFFPFYPHDIWAEIIGVLGPDDIAALGIRHDGQMVYDWIWILALAAAKLRDTEPCDRDHCPDNHCENSNHKPLESPNAKA